MAFNFKNIAQNATTLSDIMNNRTKVNKTDGEYTIVDFDVVTVKGSTYALCAINDKEYINGGTVLTRVFQDIIACFEGDIEAAREEYKESEPLKVRLTRGMTKEGKNITTVDIL